MFEAECPSCSATYQVDERRVPPTGLKMRCPKCGESFHVKKPAPADSPVLGAVLGLGEEGSISTRPPPAGKNGLKTGSHGSASRAVPKNTILGVGPSEGVAGLELASLDEDLKVDVDADADELDLSAVPADSSDFDLPLRVGGSPDSPPVDLSTSVHPSSASEVEEDELDLPVLGKKSPPLPTLDLSAGEADEDEFDLPAMGATTGLPAAVDAELPDLNAELPDLGAELPDLGAELPDLGAELPDLDASPASQGGSLPDLAGELPDLGATLPELGGALPEPASGLPSVGQEEASAVLVGDLEDVQELGLEEGAVALDLSAAPPAPQHDGAVPSDDIFGQGPTLSPETLPPLQEKSSAEASTFDEVSLDASVDEQDDEFDAFPTEGATPSKASTRSAEGYGDVELDGNSGDIDLGADLVHSNAPPPLSPAAPGGPAPAASALVEAPTPTESKKGEGKKLRRRTSGLSKGTRVILMAAVGLAIGGGALTLVPELGPYGVYWLLDTMNVDKYRAALASDVQSATQKLEQDTAENVSGAFDELEGARAQAPRDKARTAFTAYVGFVYQLRFGGSSDVSARAQVLLDSLVDADSATNYLSLARLAKLAASGDAKSVITTASRLLTQGTRQAMVVGEAALREKNAELALKAWEVVFKAGATPRSQFGMARALRLSGKSEEAQLHIQATLEGNPHHAGARLLVAAIQLTERGLDEEIEKSLTPLSQGKGASPGEQVQALILLGELHLSRARIKRAEAAFVTALKMDSGSAAAQRGLAQALFDSGRFSEALIRFEAALQSGPNDLIAHLGLVQSKLRLEQLEDAVIHLKTLEKKHPKSSAVAYWVGRGRESVGEKREAEKAYEKAIERGESSPELVFSYIALTRLLGQRGSLAEAKEVISQAEKRFPEDPKVYGALGELSGSRGSYQEAVKYFDKALALDTRNIGLRFSRAVALRQARRFDEATTDFDTVQKQSPEYPGLALERGNLFEASGRTVEALKAYESALKAAPEDLDLMLRVACGKASAGQSDSVVKLLEPVLEKRGNSAEANFCMGLAVLNSGKDIVSAQRYLERAVNRDASRAKYHLYVGWAAMELKDYAKANLSFDKTIELDRSLADAYWKRGELRVRQGAVLDALSDLGRALELAPTRFAVHASRARALQQLGKESQAMEAWSRAISSEEVDPTWNREYGELLLANRRPEEARVQLTLALAAAEKLKVEAIWIANAHRLLAMSIGRKKEAIPHWEAFLKAKKGSNNPYLREALAELTAILNQSGF